MHAGGNHDRLAGRGQNRAGHHVVDGRGRIVDEATVARPGCAEIRRHREPAGRFEMIAAQTEQNVGTAMEPFDLRRNCPGIIGVISSEQNRLDAIGSRVTASAGHHAQRTRTGEARRFEAGEHMVSLKNPVGEAAFEVGILHQVLAVQNARNANLDVVHETLPGIEEINLESIPTAVGHRHVIQRAGDTDRGPGALGSVVAVGPIRGQPMIGAGVDQLQTAAAAVVPPAPTPTAAAGAVGHVIHFDVEDIRLYHPTGVGGHQGVGHGQGQSFARISQRAIVVPDRVGCGQVRIVGHQARGIFGDDEIAVGRDHRVGKSEVDAVGKPPALEVDRAGAAIVKLDELVVIVVRDRVVHDLVDPDVVDAPGGVGRAGSPGRQRPKGRRSIRITARGDAVLLAGKRNGVHHPSAIGVDQVNGFSGRAQGKTEGRLREINEAGRTDGGAVRNAKFVGGRIVAQPAAGQVDRRSAVVVEFEVIDFRQVGVGQEFVDHHVAEGVEFDPVGSSGGTADGIAGPPGLCVAFSVRWPQQHQGVPRPICGHRPGRLALIGHLQQDGIDSIAQPHRP